MTTTWTTSDATRVLLILIPIEARVKSKRDDDLDDFGGQLRELGHEGLGKGLEVLPLVLLEAAVRTGVRLEVGPEREPRSASARVGDLLEVRIVINWVYVVPVGASTK